MIFFCVKMHIYFLICVNNRFNKYLIRIWSTSLCVCLTTCLPVYVSICLFFVPAYPFIRLLVYIFICLQVDMSVWLLLNLFPVYLSMSSCMPVNLYLFFFLLVYFLPAYLFTCLPVHKSTCSLCINISKCMLICNL